MKNIHGSLLALFVGGLLLYGQATHYAPNVFARVWSYRSAYMEECVECVGFAAMLDADFMGQKVWISMDGEQWVGPLLVADCANDNHRAMLINRGWVIDIDYNTWYNVLHWPRRPVQVIVALEEDKETRQDRCRVNGFC